ncbi:hypothetical protein LL999_10200 [Burkholderia ambifaria]|nr:hypothetical protein LL999_10200 [Burkholderia ambifaria]
MQFHERTRLGKTHVAAGLQHPRTPCGRRTDDERGDRRAASRGGKPRQHVEQHGPGSRIGFDQHDRVEAVLRRREAAVAPLVDTLHTVRAFAKRLVEPRRLGRRRGNQQDAHRPFSRALIRASVASIRP